MTHLEERALRDHVAERMMYAKTCIAGGKKLDMFHAGKWDHMASELAYHLGGRTLTQYKWMHDILITRMFSF